MADLERQHGTRLDGYATVHQNTDNPYVHLVLRGTGERLDTGETGPVELTPQHFKLLRESGREHSQYEHYRQLHEVMQQLNELDPLGKENPLEFLQTHQRDRSAEWEMER